MNLDCFRRFRTDRGFSGFTFRVPASLRLVSTEPVNQRNPLCEGSRFPRQSGQKEAENALRTFSRCRNRTRRPPNRSKTPGRPFGSNASLLWSNSAQTFRRCPPNAILSFRSVYGPRSVSSLVRLGDVRASSGVGRAAAPLAPERVYKTDRRYRDLAVKIRAPAGRSLIQRRVLTIRFCLWSHRCMCVRAYSNSRGRTIVPSRCSRTLVGKSISLNFKHVFI